MEETHVTLMMIQGVLGETRGRDGDTTSREILKGLRGRIILTNRGAVLLIGRVIAHQTTGRDLLRKRDNLLKRIRDHQHTGSKGPLSILHQSAKFEIILPGFPKGGIPMIPPWSRGSSAGRVPDTEGGKIKWSSGMKGEIVLTHLRSAGRIVVTVILLAMPPGTFREAPVVVIIPTAPEKDSALRIQEKRRIPDEDKICLVTWILLLMIPGSLLLKARFRGILPENNLCLVPGFLTLTLKPDRILGWS